LRCRVFVISREALKRVSHRGSTEGTTVLTYATLQSIYEYFIVLKTKNYAAAAREPSLTRSPP
jgi:hypothetical protein